MGQPLTARKRSAVALMAAVAAVAVAASACSSSSDSSGGNGGSGGGDIVLGANVELTGLQASLGVQFKNGLQLAVDQVNGNSGFKVGDKTYHFKLDLQDNKSDPQQAVVIDQQFKQKGVKFVLGPAASAGFAPAFKALSGYDFVNFTPATAAIPFLGTSDGKYLFDTHIPEDGDQGRDAQIVRLLVENYHPKTAAILLPQDANGELFTKAFTSAFQSAGVKIVYSKSFPGETTDFSSYLTAMKPLNPDIVVQGYLNTRTAPFLKQAVQAGFTNPVFVSAPGGDAGALADVKSDIKTYIWSVATRSVTDTTDPGIAEYNKLYIAKYGSAPTDDGFWALSYYDSVLMLAKAMQAAQSTSDLAAISDQLTKVTSWDGAAMPDRRYDAKSHFAVYTPQIGVYAHGSITYVQAR